jgi:putative polymerase
MQSKQEQLTLFPTPTYPERLVTGILITSVCYLSVLSFLNAKGFSASAALVGATEALIYTVCLFVLRHNLSITTITFSFCTFAWLIFAWLIRQAPDIKGARDLVIPVLFFNLGRYVADKKFADRALKLITLIIISVALFEAFFEDIYANIFNTFSFYNKTGGISESSAMFGGQLLTLNGYRPEGIGRTILPFILGPHRISSLLMEPVGLGNLSVILMAWVLSKPWLEIKKNYFFLISSILLISLSDSRFGLLMCCVLIMVRIFPIQVVRNISPSVPFLILAIVIGIASTSKIDGDNFVGRITTSGIEILNFDWSLLLGLNGLMPYYGDMGYAYFISRFGAPLSIGFIAVVYFIPMTNKRGSWFRTLIMLYIFSNLAISGTSVFALKTAGIAWFLMGVLVDRPKAPEHNPPEPHRSYGSIPMTTSSSIWSPNGNRV